MTILHGKFVFVHVPKTGGMSVKAAIGNVIGSVPNHVPSQCVLHYGLPVVGTIRNPWERMASLYQFVAGKDRDPLDRLDWKWMKEVGFKRWLMEGAQYLASDFVDGKWYDRTNRSPRKADRFVWQHEKSFKGQERYVENGLPPLQQRPAMWWLKHADYILMTENLEEGLNETLRRLGAKQVELPRQNRTRVKVSDRWQDLYDDESAAFVKYWHNDDIKAAGYQFV